MSNDAQTPDSVPTTYQRLAAPFAVADHAKVNKGSGSQTYAPWTAYVERLNDELGANWSFRIVREGFTPTECWVLGEITAVVDGVTVTRQQYGCEPIVKGQRETPTADLLKTAASDAIKKAASLLGPGLYLSVKEEREAIEAEMRAAVQAEAQRQADERREANRPKAPATTNAASPGTTTSRSASTPSAISAASNSSSTPATTAPSTSEPVQAAAVLTGASETLQQQWQRLVAEAERVKLPTLGQVKAIDPKAVGTAQLKKYANLLTERLYAAREGAA